MPLLTGIDGVQKMSKSFGNQIGLTDAPGEMYGKTLRIRDEQIEPGSRCCWASSRRAGAGPRDAKRALARALVTRFHGADAAAEAEAGFDRVFIEHELPDEVEEAVVRGHGRDRAPAGRDRRGVRPLALGGAPDARAGRRPARRRSRSRRMSSTCPPATLDGRVLRSESGISADRRLTVQWRHRCHGALKAGGCATLHCPLGMTRAAPCPDEFPPDRKGATVFENSTACAPSGLHTGRLMCVQVRPLAARPGQK